MDRLAEIEVKAQSEGIELFGSVEVDADDLQWLIAEIKRLRHELAHD